MFKKVLWIFYICFSVSIFILYFNMHFYDDYQTSLLQGTYIQDKQTDLIAHSWSVPLAIDWNGDGRKDLLIGNRDGSNGHINFYPNKGTDNSPAFEGSIPVKTCTDICADLTVIPDG